MCADRKSACDASVTYRCKGGVGMSNELLLDIENIAVHQWL